MNYKKAESGETKKEVREMSKDITIGVVSLGLALGNKLMVEFERINNLDITRKYYERKMLSFANEVFDQGKLEKNDLYFNLYHNLLDLSVNCEDNIIYDRCVELINKIEGEK